MKAVRIVQLVLLVLVALYLFLFNNLNPQPVNLPWVVPVAPVYVVIAALVAGWLVGWVPARVELWRRRREIGRLRRRVAELERAPSFVPAGDFHTPIIPDRLPSEGEHARRHETPDDEASSL